MSGPNETVTITVKGIGDFSDVVSNVGAVQKALTKLKLPDKLGDNLNKNITAFMSEYEKYQKKVSEGLKTQGDYNQVEKSLNRMRSLYQEIGRDTQKLTQLDMKDMLNLDTNEFKKISNELTSIIKQIGGMKFDTTPFTKAFADIRKITKSTKITGDNGILSQMIGNINSGQISEAKKQLQELQVYAKKVAPRTTAEGKQAPGTLSPEKYKQLTAAIEIMNQAFSQSDEAMAPLIQKQNELQQELEETKQKAAQGLKNEFDKYSDAGKDIDNVTNSLKRMHQEEFSFSREVQNIDRQIQSYFGLSQMIRKVGDIAKDAFATVKELDAAMTETAVVTNFSVGDMWEMLPTYTEQANQLGSTIKDVYDAATLYYQQGLNTNQAMGLANETLKMARIAGLDAADATNMMTAALRGFNMEINQMSAQKVNDIYSELAAITASDTAEIGSAMERTASIANSANMEFATTSAFLAQMIETTREAPENLGTAMKTIVARFQEMKQDPTKLIDSEGVAMDANKVDKALKSIGVQLMNTKGEFRDLDDVFLDIASKWDTLSQGQQRYIATIAAGSRQQSRFIAMMSNYERTMELVDAANNSAGASQRQFEKTLDSMDTKLNKLKNAWDQFTMGLMNNQILKLGVSALTEGLTIVNKFVDVLGKIPPKPFEGITKSALTLATTLGMLQVGKKLTRGLVMGTTGWWKNEGGFKKNFASGWRGGVAEANQSGNKSGITWTQAVSKAINSGSNSIKGAMREAFALNEAGSPDAIRASLSTVLQNIQAQSNNFGLGEEGKEAADAFRDGLIEEVEQSKSSMRQALEQAIDASEMEFDIDVLGEELQRGARASLDLDKTSLDFEDLTKKASSAGGAIKQFGYALQGTPLEGFGNKLIQIGQLMESAGQLAKTFGKNISNAFKAAKGAEAGKGISTFFTTLFPILSKIPPQVLLVIAAIAAIGGTALAVAHHNKKAFKTIQDSAAAASEAYDSAKQETSELADAIEQIQSNENAFDNLAIGTAAFNEQLVNANQQIMELIKKYPMLNEYLTTDANGLMHISQTGLDAVKEYQRQRQNNASALSILQTNDLNAAENRQKIKELNKTNAATTTKQYEDNKAEAKLIEQRIDAETQAAQLNAVHTSLAGQKLGDEKAVAAILANQYETRKKMVDIEVGSMDKHAMRQKYADFYGYDYSKSTKKITDNEGNEVEVEDSVIKDAVKDITVLEDIQVDASSVESAVNSVDRAFSNSLVGSYEGSSHFISDLLSSNLDINTDLLNQVIESPKKLENVVNDLSAKEIAGVLGVSESTVEGNISKYKSELTNKLTEQARNLAKSQADSFGDLATMIAQSQGKSVKSISKDKGQQKELLNQVQQMTAQQRNTLLNVGKTLRDSVGSDTMGTFINQMSSIYKSRNKDLIDTTQNIVDNVKWDSPTDRLRAYNEMINLTANDTNNLSQGSVLAINQMGNALKNSADEANLLGQAFEEFYNSSDWQEMAENMDKFVDSSGKLNASAVLDMADECGSLNNLLETGEINAGGMAVALNALGSDGNLVLSDLNSHVLELLSHFAELDSVMASAHNTIANFDAGIDTGEGEDFINESVKKFNELYENGEYGNPQAEAYAKLVVGEDRWIQKLAENKGNLEKTLDAFAPTINQFSEGFYDAWSDLANAETTLNGITTSWNDDGTIHLDVGDKTTDEVVQYLQDVKNISKEMAEMMLTDFENYSGDLKAELQKNDFEAGLTEGKYIEGRQTAEGKVGITASELNTIAAATGMNTKEIVGKIEEASGQQVDVLQNIDESTGKYIDNYGALNKMFSEKMGFSSQNGWLTQYQQEGKKNGIDIGAAIEGAIDRGFTQSQATGMAFESFQNAKDQGKDYYYKGEKLDPSEITSLDEFANKLAEIDQSAQWTQVGQQIAAGYLAYIKGMDNPANQPDKNKGLNNYENGSQKGGGQGYGNTAQELPGAAAAREQKLTGGYSDDAAASAAKENVVNAFKKVGQFLTAGAEEGGRGMQDAAAMSVKKSQESFDKGVDTASANVDTSKSEQAGKKVVEKKSKAYDTGSSKETATPSRAPAATPTKPTTLKTTETPKKQDTTLTVHTNDKELTATKSKIDKLIATTKHPATLTVKAKTGNSTQAAIANINKVKDATKGNNTIKVGAKVTGQSQVNSLKSAIEGVKSKTAKIKASVSGLSSVQSLKSAVDGLRSKTITITTKKVTIGKADGTNNKISYHHVPQAGSAAKGTKHGRVGARFNGGLTLTGEEGYEIAWLPKESRSLILGANGPQMIDLPRDVVIYNHEQSEEIMKKRKNIEGGSAASGYGKKYVGGSTGSSSSFSGGSGSSGSRQSSDSGDEDKKSQQINHFSIYEIIRFDNDQYLAVLSSEISKRTKSIEKSLKKIGIQANSIRSNIQQQVAALEKVKQNNQDNLNAYRNEINDFLSQQALATWTDANGESQERKFDIRSFIGQANGTYVIDWKAIQRIAGSREEQEAIYKELEPIKNLTDGVIKAQEAIDDANEQIEKLGEQLAEQFYNWKSELTEIYDLSQRITDQESLRSRFTSQINLELSKLSAGFGTATEAIEHMTAARERDNKTVLKQIENQQVMIAARQRELNRALDASDELATLNAYKNRGYSTASEKNAAVAWAQGEYDAARIALQYVKDIKKDRDGSVQYTIDWAAFDRQQAANPYSKDTYDKIKEYLDNLNSAAEEFNNSIKTQTETIAQLYDDLKEYQDFIGSFEDTLIKTIESDIEQQLENAKRLSDSITAALKDLLDQVKRKLDERRQAEDNAKTEADIAKKQQRLAMLQANSAGGNQVEIAQLQKEIADAQQSYQRTLEDQLLNKLQQQGDDAAKQREHQIELQKAQLDVEKETNKELVNLWLSNPEEYKNEIRDAWLEAQGYEDKGIAGQAVLESEFESEFAKLGLAIEETNYKNGFEDISGDTSTLVGLLTKLTNGEDAGTDPLSKAVSALEDVTKRNTESFELSKKAQQSAVAWKNEGITAKDLKAWDYTFKELKDSGFTNAELKQAGFTLSQFQQGGVTNAADLRGAGFSVAELKNAKYNFKQLQDAGFNLSQLRQGGFSISDFMANGIKDAKTLKGAGFTAANLRGAKFSSAALRNAGFTAADLLKGGYSAKDLRTGGYTAAQAKAAGVSAAGLKGAGYKYSDAKKSGYSLQQLYSGGYGEAYWEIWPYGRVSDNTRNLYYGDRGKDVKALQWALNKMLGTNLDIDGWYADYTWDAVTEAERIFYGHPGDRIIGPQDRGEFRKRGFKTGGIADFTGPAWLDGTPSKPELVLNAQDTKNFLALKDVLRGAMSSIGSVKGSSYGDMTYEININVDHINNDYDVDRIAERVKKNIAKDASYRNVTQVRNFR